MVCAGQVRQQTPAPHTRYLPNTRGTFPAYAGTPYLTARTRAAGKGSPASAYAPTPLHLLTTRDTTPTLLQHELLWPATPLRTASVRNGFATAIHLTLPGGTPPYPIAAETAMASNDTGDSSSLVRDCHSGLHHRQAYYSATHLTLPAIPHKPSHQGGQGLQGSCFICENPSLGLQERVHGKDGLQGLVVYT